MGQMKPKKKKQTEQMKLKKQRMQMYLLIFQMLFSLPALCRSRKEGRLSGQYSRLQRQENGCPQLFS